jgi:hypothetical protein
MLRVTIGALAALPPGRGSRPRPVMVIWRPPSGDGSVWTMVAQPGIAIEVRCKGRGCPWAKRALQPGRTPKALKRARLRPGAKLEVWITKPGTIGKVVRIAVRRKQVPRRVALCLPPAAAGPARC